MTGDNDNLGETNDEDDAVADAVADGDIVVDTDDDDVIPDSTAEIEVDKLVAKIDSEDADEVARQREIREKMDALREQRDDKFGSTYNFDLDDDL